MVEKTRAKIPDAVYTTSAELADALAKLSKSGGFWLMQDKVPANEGDGV